MVLDPNKNVDPKCLFCNEDIGLRLRERGRHIGRHMEEIAFAIVTKPYEEWDFYSGSSKEYYDHPSLLPAASSPSIPILYPCICHDCGVKLHTVAERADHFSSVHRAQSHGEYQCRCSSILKQPPCNTIFASSMDLGTHVFISHTKGRKYYCERCNCGNSLLRTCSITKRRNPYPIPGAEQRQCGLCGHFLPYNELYLLDGFQDTARTIAFAQTRPSSRP